MLYVYTSNSNVPDIYIFIYIYAHFKPVMALDRTHVRLVRTPSHLSKDVDSRSLEEVNPCLDAMGERRTDVLGHL